MVKQLSHQTSHDSPALQRLQQQLNPEIRYIVNGSKYTMAFSGVGLEKETISDVRFFVQIHQVTNKSKQQLKFKIE
jgi:hypothetical protein